jgi:hypothetical protein
MGKNNPQANPSHRAKNPRFSFLKACTVFFALPLAPASAIFYVMLFVPTLMHHIAFSFS